MDDGRGSATPASDDERVDVIRLDLDRAIDMFETPVVELGSSHGMFQPGIERCVAEVTSQPIGHAFRLELILPPSEITPGLEERLATTLRRYCDERAQTDDRKRRSMQRSGMRALRIGLPVTLFGLAITALAFHVGDGDDPQTAVVDIIGWVLAWLGLWYPFDKLLFYPSDYVREIRALNALRDATITVVPRTVESGATTAPEGRDGSTAV
jgi:hypothetical protein